VNRPFINRPNDRFGNDDNPVKMVGHHHELACLDFRADFGGLQPFIPHSTSVFIQRHRTVSISPNKHALSCVHIVTK